MIIRRFSNLESLSRKAASFISQLAQQAVEQKGRFTIALSGGRSPQTLFEVLSLPPYRTKMPWQHIHFFWGDERCVSPDHADSNYKMAHDALLSKVPVPGQNIYRMRAERKPLSRVVRDYEKTLRRLGPLDLILLGVGGDGHTASLFPENKILLERKRWVAAVRAPKGIISPRRITLTLPAINAAREVLFITGTKGKDDILTELLDPSNFNADEYPAGMVNPQGRCAWFIAEDS